MRLVVLILALAFAGGLTACSRMRAASAAAAPLSLDARLSSPSTPSKIDFTTQIRPILEARCQPCHFNGGKMYARLPFDRPETVKSLGTKLFTRIKDSKEQQLIRDFLAQ